MPKVPLWTSSATARRSLAACFPRATLRERHGSQRAVQGSGRDAHVARVEGTRPRGPAGTRASRPVDARPAQAMGGNGCKRERGWTDRRTPRRLEEGHGGHAQPVDRSAHRPCRRLPERRRASNLHPRRAYALTLNPWPDRSAGVAMLGHVEVPVLESGTFIETAVVGLYAAQAPSRRDGRFGRKAVVPH
jgi:hypothetical protein